MAGYFHCVNETFASAKLKSYKLKFITGVASPVFTGKKIRGEASDGSESIKVILVDGHTDQPIIDEMASSKRVRIVILPEDFGDFGTSFQFENSIITDWKNKKNILQGNCFVDLKHGSGTIGKIWIKHDKNHLSKVKFRLGAMIEDCSYEIKEAITEPFEVKDRRNQLYCKSPSVNLSDKVWRLKNIGRKGPICKRLKIAKITTVNDFLDRLFSNSLDLQKIYGSNGKRWDETVRHAKTSSYDKKCNVCGSVGLAQGLDNMTAGNLDGRTELDVDSYEPSSLSNDTMAFDQFHLPTPNFEEYDEVDDHLSVPSLSTILSWLGK